MAVFFVKKFENSTEDFENKILIAILTTGVFCIEDKRNYVPQRGTTGNCSWNFISCNRIKLSPD